MRAYVIASDDTNVHFLSYDEEFLEKLRLIYNGDGTSNHLSQDPAENAVYVQKLISPIITSYSALEMHFDEQCVSVSNAETGCNVTFQKHGSYIYIGFCNHVEYSCPQLSRILEVLHSLTQFFYGPCEQLINPANPEKRSRSWQKLSQALEAFCHLWENEQSFMLGCVEHLHINTDIQKKYSGMTDQFVKIATCNVVPKNGRSHGILFVGNKILAQSTFPSSRSPVLDISTPDFLQILIAMNSKHQEGEMMISSAQDVFELCQTDTIEDHTEEHADEMRNEEIRFLPSQSSEPSFSNLHTLKRSQSCNVSIMRRHSVMSSQDFGSNEEVFPQSSLKRTSKSSFTIPQDVRDSTFQYSSSHTAGQVYSPTSRTRALTRHNSTGSQFSPYLMCRVAEFAGNEVGVKTHSIFLNSLECTHTPYVMHTLQLSDQIKFVLIAEMQHIEVARNLCIFLSLLQMIRAEKNHEIFIKGGQKTIDELIKCVKQLRQRLSYKPDNQWKKIINLWDEIHLKLQSQLNSPRPSTRLIRFIQDLIANLQQFYYRMFMMIVISLKESWFPHLMQLRKSMREEIVFSEFRMSRFSFQSLLLKIVQFNSDKFNYLEVKSLRNIELSWNRLSYPGMLHYLFIRRTRTLSNPTGRHFKFTHQASKDQFSSPGIFIPSDDAVGNPKMTSLLKDQVWKGISLAHTLLKSSGRNSFQAQDGDFCFTSFAWCDIQDSTHHGRTNPQAKVPKIDLSFVRPFSRQFMKRSSGPSQASSSTQIFRIWELHFIHFSTMTSSAIYKQCLKLYSQLIESIPLKETPPLMPKNMFSSLNKT